MQENPESQEKKITKGSYFEVPGVLKTESEGESGAKPEGKNREETRGRTTALEREEPKGNEFKAPGELETGYTEESWAKPQKDMEEKGDIGSSSLEEKKVPEESKFKAPGEFETGYTEESWAKPQRDMEEKPIIEPGEKKEEKTTEETRERVEEKAGEAREKAREETREEAREEKRTAYTMKKRLTKSKKNRMLFGVCGGLGEYFGIDPTFIRLAFAALALQGIGIILYVVLAILMPSREKFEMVPSTQGSNIKR